MDKEKYKEQLIAELKGKWIEDEPYVFVSYASADWELVYPIVIDLRKKGFNVYIDTELEEVATRNWLDNIKERLYDGEIAGIISFLSISYLRSYACMIELLINKSEEMKADRGDSLPVIYIALQEGVATLQNMQEYTVSKEIRNQSKALEVKILPEERTVLEEALIDCKSYEKTAEEVKKTIDKIKTRHDVVTLAKSCIYNETLAIQKYTEKNKCVSMLETNFTNDKNKDIELPRCNKLLQDLCIDKNFPSNEMQSVEEMPSKQVDSIDYSSCLEEKTNDIGRCCVLEVEQANTERLEVTTGNLWHCISKGADAYFIWESEDRKDCIVKKGSRVAKEAPSFETSVASAYELKQELIQKGILVGDVFQSDYASNRISTVYNLVCGGSINMRGEIKSGKFTKIDSIPNIDMKNEISVINEVTTLVDEPVVTNVNADVQVNFTKFMQKVSENNFKKSTYDVVSLIGNNGCEKYSVCKKNSTADLALEFIYKLVSEYGESYILDVLAKNPKQKNPFFVKTNEVENYKLTYKAIPMMPEWSVCTNWSQCGWMKVLSARISESDFMKLEQFEVILEGCKTTVFNN